MIPQAGSIVFMQSALQELNASCRRQEIRLLDVVSFSGVILPISRPQPLTRPPSPEDNCPSVTSSTFPRNRTGTFQPSNGSHSSRAAVQSLLSPSKRHVCQNLHTRHVKGNNVELRAGRSHSPPRYMTSPRSRSGRTAPTVSGTVSVVPARPATASADSPS